MNLAEHLPLIGTIAFLALVPFVFILMTSFTRISIVLTFLRQALGTTVPSSQIIIGLSLILTGYIMHPVITEIYKSVEKPYTEQALIDKGWPPLQHFMVTHTREKDLELFLEMGHVELPNEADLKEIPWYVTIPAFVLSELRVAFMMGFLLFLPFLIIDMVVTSLLMSLGMVMLPPVMISFPFKILLFVVVDGWRLIVQQVVAGY